MGGGCWAGILYILRSMSCMRYWRSSLLLLLLLLLLMMMVVVRMLLLLMLLLLLLMLMQRWQRRLALHSCKSVGALLREGRGGGRWWACVLCASSAQPG